MVETIIIPQVQDDHLEDFRAVSQPVRFRAGKVSQLDVLAELQRGFGRDNNCCQMARGPSLKGFDLVDL